MTNHCCPRCGEALPQTSYWEALPAPPDREPAYRLRHKRQDGHTCIAYAGPERPVRTPAISIAAGRVQRIGGAT